MKTLNSRPPFFAQPELDRGSALEKAFLACGVNRSGAEILALFDQARQSLRENLGRSMDDRIEIPLPRAEQGDALTLSERHD